MGRNENTKKLRRSTEKLAKRKGKRKIEDRKRKRRRQGKKTRYGR